MVISSRFPPRESLVNPFPGLRPYESSESDIFFGREDQIHELLTRLRQNRFLSIVGSSGSGKSSIIRAGMLPALSGGYMTEVGGSWRIAIMRPGDNPIAHLAGALTHPDALGAPLDEGTDAASLMQATVRRGSRGLIEAARETPLAPTDKLLVLVDQFEELFRFIHDAESAFANTSDEAEAFVNLLLQATRQVETPIYVVLTMRAEFLGRCAQFPDLPDAINQGLYLVPRMSREQLRDAIEGPIPGQISNRLVNRLLNDLGDDPDQLPILQHALMRLWNVWQTDGGTGQIDIDHYEQIGRLEDALGNHLDEIMAELERPRPNAPPRNVVPTKVAEIVFRNLTEISAEGRMVRRPQRLSRLVEVANVSEAEVIAVIDRFREPGRSFLMPPMPEQLKPASIIDISHESLIRQWPKLLEWTREEDKARRVHHYVADESRKWDEGKRGRGYLLVGSRLAEAEEWQAEHPGEVSPLETEFLSASLFQRNREARAKMLFGTSAVVALVALGGLVFTIWFWQAARTAAFDLQIAGKDKDRALAEAKNSADAAGQSLILEQRALKDALDARKNAEKAAKEALLARQEAERDRTKLKLATAAYNRGLLAAGIRDKATTLLNSGDLYGAARWSADALNYEDSPVRNDLLRVRLSAILQNAPHLVQLWHLDAPDIAAAIQPDTRQIISISSRNGLQISDIAQGKVIAGFQDANTTFLAASANGTWGLLTRGDGKVRLRNLSTGKETPLADRDQIITRDKKNLVSLRVPDEDIDDDAPDAALAPAKAQEPRSAKPGAQDEAVFAFSADERWLGAAVQGDVLRWNLAGDLKKPERYSLGKRIVRIDFSRNGQSLVALATEESEALASVPAAKSSGSSGSSRRESTPEGRSTSDRRPGSENEAQTNAAARRNARVSTVAYVVSLNHPERAASRILLVSIVGQNNNKTYRMTWPAPPSEQAARPNEPVASESVEERTRSIDATQVTVAPDGRLVLIKFAELSGESHDREQRGTQKQEIGRVGIWDIETKKCVLLSPWGYAVVSAWWFPDGRRILAADSHGKAWIFNAQPPVASNSSSRSSSSDREPKGTLLQPAHRERIVDVSFSQDGRWIATASSDHTARLWGAESAAYVSPPLSHSGPVQRVFFNSEGRYLVTLSGDNVARIWDLDARCHSASLLGGVNRGRVNTHGEVRRAQLSHDGSLLATIHADNTVCVWDTKTTKLVGEPLPHSGTVPSAEFSLDDRLLLTPSYDHHARLWEVKTGKLVRIFTHDRDVNDASWSPDGRTIVSCSDAGDAQVWDAASGNVIVRVEHGGIVMHARFNRTGKTIFTSALGNYQQPELGRTVKLWDLSQGSAIRKEPTFALPHTGNVYDTNFNAQGDLVVTASEDRTAKVWRVATGELIDPPLEHNGSVGRAAFSPDGKLIATSSHDSFVRIWDGASHKPVGSPFPQTKAVSFIAFDRTGTLLLIGGEGTIRVWDVRAGEPLTPTTYGTPQITFACFDSSNPANASGPVDIRLVGRGAWIGDWKLGKNDHKAVELQQLTEVLSSTTILGDEAATSQNEPSSLKMVRDGIGVSQTRNSIPLSTDGLDTTWKKLRQWTSERLELDAAEKRTWHRRSALDCEENEEWSAAIWHLTRILEQWPDDAEALASLPQVYLRHWKTPAQKSDTSDFLASALRYVDKASAQLPRLATSDTESQANLRLDLIACYQALGDRFRERDLTDMARTQIDAAVNLLDLAAKKDVATRDTVLNLSTSIETLADKDANRVRALESYDRIVSLLVALDRESPQNDLMTRRIAELHVKVGNSYRRYERYSVAAENYSDALAAAEFLINKDSSVTEARALRDRIFQQLEDLGDQAGSFSVSDRYLKQALRKISLPTSPFLRNVIQLYAKVGTDRLDRYDEQSAKSFYEAATVFAMEPDRHDLVDAYSSLGELTYKLERYADCRDWWEKVLKVRLEAAKGAAPGEPANNSLANAYEWLADILLRVGTIAPMEEYAQRCLDLKRLRLKAKPDDDDAKNSMTYGLRWYANVALALGRQKEALDAFDEYLKLWKSYAAGNDSRRSSLVDSYERVAGIRLSVGDATGAESNCMDALKIRRELNAKKDAERKDLSSLLWKMADVNRERLNFEDARKLARTAYELDEARVAKGGTSDQANFGRDCGRLGFLAMSSGDYKDAASRFTIGIGILKTLEQKHRLMGNERQEWLQVQLRQQAVVAAINASKNLDAALDTLKAPDQAAELLILRAVLAARDGKHADAHQFAQKILQRDRTINTRSHYDVARCDAACVHAVRKGRLLSGLKVEELSAVQGYIDEAVQSLQYAIHQDAAYLPRMLNNDELDIVRDDAKYRELIDQLKKAPGAPAVTASAEAGAKASP